MTSDDSELITIRVPASWLRAIAFMAGYCHTTQSRMAAILIGQGFPKEVRAELPDLRPARRPTNEEAALHKDPTMQQIEAAYLLAYRGQLPKGSDK